ncbi:hypothetical protein ACH3XW_33620 [Acanthocheilonema viteae]
MAGCFQILFLFSIHLLLFGDSALLYSGIIEHNRQLSNPSIPYFTRNGYMRVTDETVINETTNFETN